MSMPNAFVRGSERLSDEDAELLRRREHAMGPAYRLFYANPLRVERGEGVWLYDAEGRRYLDAYNNVASVGHCHPRVVEAVARQNATLNTHTRYLNALVVHYAERLLSHFPPELEHVMFTCTGSEANDLAVRIARAATGGKGLLVTRNAYHGVTSAIAEASPSLGPANPIGEHVWLVDPPSGNVATARQFANDVSLALADMDAKGVKPAALLVDTIFSSDGIVPEPVGFLAEAVERVRSAGGLFIADEVQAGFGRLGSSMWGFTRHGVVPDLVTLGKPMGNGYPLAGVVSRAGPTRVFGETVRYFNTYGGNPVAAAAGMAVLDVIRDEQLIERAADVGAYLVNRIRDLAEDRSAIVAVRGAGLFVGVELCGPDSAERAAGIVNSMRDHGVLISATGPEANVLKIRPPLVFGRDHADVLLEALEQALGD